MDEEYDEEDEEFDLFPSIPARPIDFIVTLVATLTQVLEAIVDGLNKTVGLIASHANYKNDQRRFAENVRSELESIPTTEE